MFVLNTVSCMSQSYSSLLRIPSVVGSQGSKLSTTTVIRVRFCFCPPTRRGTASAHLRLRVQFLSVAWDESTLDLDSCAENVSLAPNDPIAHVSNTRMMQCWSHPVIQRTLLSIWACIGYRCFLCLETHPSLFYPAVMKNNPAVMKKLAGPKSRLLS